MPKAYSGHTFSIASALLRGRPLTTGESVDKLCSYSNSNSLDRIALFYACISKTTFFQEKKHKKIKDAKEFLKHSCDRGWRPKRVLSPVSRRSNRMLLRRPDRQMFHAKSPRHAYVTGNAAVHRQQPGPGTSRILFYLHRLPCCLAYDSEVRVQVAQPHSMKLTDC